MIIICKPNSERVKKYLVDQNITYQISSDNNIDVFTVSKNCDTTYLKNLPEVINIYSDTNTPLVDQHPGKINIYDQQFITNQDFMFIAGPCSIENYESFQQNIHELNQLNKIVGVRCGAYKPRTSPYTFQGQKLDGLAIANELVDEKLKVAEIMDASDLDNFQDIDILQVGARNMQNYSLIKALSEQNKPIILKRGMGATIDEWLNTAEHLMQNGNENIILCERGIKTFEHATRTSLDLTSIPVIKSKTNLPIIVDPSHACGKSEYVSAMALAAIAAGADGLLIETHHDPTQALSDGRQSITYEALNELLKTAEPMLKLLGKKIYES